MNKSDSFVLAKLAIKMWRSYSADELTKGFSDCIDNENSECFRKEI